MERNATHLHVLAPRVHHLEQRLDRQLDGLLLVQALRPLLLQVLLCVHDVRNDGRKTRGRRDEKGQSVHPIIAFTDRSTGGRPTHHRALKLAKSHLHVGGVPPADRRRLPGRVCARRVRLVERGGAVGRVGPGDDARDAEGPDAAALWVLWASRRGCAESREGFIDSIQQDPPPSIERTHPPTHPPIYIHPPTCVYFCCVRAM